MAKNFPDLTGDGKVTRADVLKGRGVFKKGGAIKAGRKAPAKKLSAATKAPNKVVKKSK